MTDTQYQMLRKFGQFTRNIRFFTGTNTSIGDVVMATTTAQANLKSLVDQGLIYPIRGDAYRITEVGRNLLDMKGKEQADYSRIPKEPYKPGPWVVARGAEAEAFLLIKSVGR